MSPHRTLPPARGIHLNCYLLPLSDCLSHSRGWHPRCETIWPACLLRKAVWFGPVPQPVLLLLPRQRPPNWAVRPRPQWPAKFTRSESEGVSQTTSPIPFHSSFNCCRHFIYVLCFFHCSLVSAPLNRCRLDALVTQICIGQFCTEQSWHVRTKGDWTCVGCVPWTRWRL